MAALGAQVLPLPSFILSYSLRSNELVPVTQIEQSVKTYKLLRLFKTRSLKRKMSLLHIKFFTNGKAA